MEELERAAPGSSVRTGWLDRVLGTPRRRPPPAGGRPRHAPRRACAGPPPRWRCARSRASGSSATHGSPPDGWPPPGAPRPPPPAPSPSPRPPSPTPSRVRTRIPAGTGYPDTRARERAADVARLVKADVGVQVATVDQGDWDMHEGLGTVDDGRMAASSPSSPRALAAFAADLGPLTGRVTLVTLSEFGRRVAENGSGGRRPRPRQRRAPARRRRGRRPGARRLARPRRPTGSTTATSP